MRLGTLELVAFGPFTNVSLDLSAGAPGGFHLVFGPNEAGKSTSLRAVKGLLFGIPETSPDAHSHPASQLRVGGLIEASGFTARLFRLRRRKSSLVDEASNPFPEPRLAEALGYLDERSFETRFGLDQVELEKGAEALLAGREQGLFAAGTAGADVRQVLLELEKEHEEIFTKRGRVRPLNQAVLRYREAARSLTQLVKPPELWVEQESARRKVVEELERLREARRNTRLEHVALSRLGSMMSQFAELEELESEHGRLILELPSGQPLASGAREGRTRAQAELFEAKRQGVQCDSEIQRLEAALSKLNEPGRLEERSRLLQMRDEAVSLRERLGSARNARADLSRLRTKEQTALAEVARVLDGAGIRPEGIEKALAGQASRSFIEAASLSLIAPVSAPTLRKLLRREEVLRAEKNNLSGAIRELTEDLLSEEGAGQKEAPAEGLPRPEWLSTVIAGARRVLDGQKSRRELQDEGSAARSRVSALGRELGLSEMSSRDRVEQGVLSASERAKKLAEHERLRRECEQCERSHSRATEELGATARELEILAEQGALPSLAALAQARKERDTAILRALAAGEALDAVLQEELLSLVTKADRISDELRTEAARVARGRELRSRIEKLEKEAADSLKAQKEALVRAREIAVGLERRLEELGMRSGEADVPALLERFARLEEFVRARGDLQHLEETLAQNDAREREAREHLLEALGTAAHPGHELLELRELIAQAEQVVSAARSAARIGQERRERTEKGRRRLATLKSKLSAVEAELKEVAHELCRLREHLRLPSETAVSELEAMLAASEAALVPLTEARQLAQRQDGIARDADLLTVEINELIARIAPDISAPDAFRAADILLERAAEAERAHEEAVRLEQELAERRRQKEKIRQRQEQAELELSRLLRDAHAADLDELERREETSERVLLLRERRAKLLASLQEKAGDAPLAALRKEAAASDHRAIFGRIEAMSEELEALNEQVSARESELHNLELGLARFQTADAAEVRQLVALRGEETRELIRGYLVRRTARLLLSREVSRYASSFAAPTAERASVLFERLTLGKYRRISVDPFDSELRVATDSKELTPSELSRGTRAQMYLALRLASLESYFAHHEPVPLVLDDLLVDFDDERATAAFEVLGELSERVQILYFTHLSRDLERAADAVPRKLFRYHRLGA